METQNKTLFNFLKESPYTDEEKAELTLYIDGLLPSDDLLNKSEGLKC
jgi:hypothetical protein